MSKYEDEYTKMCDEKIEFWREAKHFHIKVEMMVQERIYEMNDTRDEEEIRNEIMTELQEK